MAATGFRFIRARISGGAWKVIRGRYAFHAERGGAVSPCQRTRSRLEHLEASRLSARRGTICNPQAEAYTLYLALWRRRLQQVHRTLYTSPASVKDMGVDHRGLHALVTEELLHGLDVVAVHQQVRGEGSAAGYGRSPVSRCQPPEPPGGTPSGRSGRTGDAAGALPTGDLLVCTLPDGIGRREAAAPPGRPAAWRSLEASLFRLSALR
jgi:hypothetical protein